MEEDNGIVIAPWTEAEVDHLNKLQHFPLFHGYTCGSGRRTDADHLDGQGLLVATTEGWKCPYCDYTQDWVSDFLLQVDMEGMKTRYPAFFKD